MRLAVKYQGKADKGKFVPSDPQAWALAFCPHEGKEVEVLVDRKRTHRSNQQNRFYWGVVVPLIADKIGERDKEAVHDMLKAEFHFDVKRVGEREIKVPQSTKDLDTGEFKEYIETIQEWASRFLGLYIPDPDADLAVV